MNLSQHIRARMETDTFPSYKTNHVISMFSQAISVGLPSNLAMQMSKTISVAWRARAVTDQVIRDLQSRSPYSE